MSTTFGHPARLYRCKAFDFHFLFGTNWKSEIRKSTNCTQFKNSMRKIQIFTVFGVNGSKRGKKMSRRPGINFKWLKFSSSKDQINSISFIFSWINKWLRESGFIFAEALMFPQKCVGQTLLIDASRPPLSNSRFAANYQVFFFKWRKIKAGKWMKQSILNFFIVLALWCSNSSRKKWPQWERQNHTKTNRM